MSNITIASSYNPFYVYDTTASTSSSTGSLVISGGAGIAGNLNVAGTIGVNNFYLGTSASISGSGVALINTGTAPSSTPSSGVYLYSISNRLVTRNNTINIHDGSEVTVRVKTAAALPGGTVTYNSNVLTGTTSLSTIDGISVSIGDYVLVDSMCTNLDDPAHRGIYVITTINTAFELTRATFANNSLLLKKGLKIIVQEGAAYGGTVWIHNTNSTTSSAITFDTTALSFIRMFAEGTNHNSLAGLTVNDDHTQYMMLAGRSGGQIAYGGTGSGDNLVLRSSSNATKGQVYIDESTASSSSTTGALRVGGGVGIGGKLYVGDATDASSSSTGAVVLSGGLGIAKKIYAGDDIHITGSLYLSNTIYGSGTNTDVPIYPNGTGRVLLNGDPTLPFHAATKAYVDAVALGLGPKTAVEMKFTNAELNTIATNGVTWNGTNKTLTSNVNGALSTIDSITAVVGYRVLLARTGDTTPTGLSVHYGIYDITDLGSAGTPWILTRSPDCDNSPTVGEYVTGIYTFVLFGTTFANQSWVLTTIGTITFGTTSQSWSQSSGGVSSSLTINDLTTNNITLAVVSPQTISTTTGALTIAPSGGGVTINTSSNGNIALAPGGTGKVTVSSVLDVSTITSTSVLIATTSNGNINLSPNGTGVVAGGTVSGGDLVLQSTSNATRGVVRMVDSASIGVPVGTSINMNGATALVLENTASPTADPNTDQMYVYNRNGNLAYRAAGGSETIIYPSLTGNDARLKLVNTLGAELSTITDISVKKNGRIMYVNARITTIAGLTAGTLFTISDSAYSPDSTNYVANDTDFVAPSTLGTLTCYNAAGAIVDTCSIKFSRAGNSGAWTGLSYTGGANAGTTTNAVLTLSYITTTDLLGNIPLNDAINYNLALGMVDITNLFTSNTTYIPAGNFRATLNGTYIKMIGSRNNTNIPSGTIIFTINNSYAFGNSSIYATGSNCGMFVGTTEHLEFFDSTLNTISVASNINTADHTQFEIAFIPQNYLNIPTDLYGIKLSSSDISDNLAFGAGVVTKQSGSVVASGTGYTTINLGSGASAVDSFYVGNQIQTYNSGLALVDVRRIVSYVGATKIATIDTQFSIVPDATYTYKVFNGSLQAQLIDKSIRMSFTCRLNGASPPRTIFTISNSNYRPDWTSIYTTDLYYSGNVNGSGSAVSFKITAGGGIITNDSGGANNDYVRGTIDYIISSTSVTGGVVAGTGATNINQLALDTGSIIGGSASGGDLTLQTTTSGTKGRVYLPEGTASTSTTTGAFVAAGGIGVGMNSTFGGNVDVAGNVVAPTIAGNVSTANNLTIRANTADLTTGQVNFTSSLDASSTTVASSTFAGGVGIAKKLFVGDATTMTSLSATGAISTTNATASTTTGTGALIVTGGAGIGGAMYVGGIVNATSSTASTTTGTGALVVTGGVGVGGAVFVGGAVNATANVSSTSTTTGSVIVTGGVGVSGNLNVGAQIITPLIAGSTVTANNLTIRANTADLTTGQINHTSSLDASSTTVASATFAGGVGIAKKLFVGDATTLTSISATGAISTSNATASTTTGTGSIIAGGGLGVAGAINAGGTIKTTDATVSTTTATGSIIAGGGLGVAGAANIGGVVKLNAGIATGGTTTGTLIVTGGVGISGGLNIGDVTSLTGGIATGGTTTGTLVVTGGVGISGTINIGGAVNAGGAIKTTDTTASTTTGTGSLIAGGGLGVAGAANIGGITKLTSGTASSSTTTGTLVVTGGTGISGDLNVGGSISLGGSFITATLAGSTTTGNSLTIRPNTADLTTGQVNFTNTTPATSTTVASAMFAGGIGVAAKSYLSAINVTGATDINITGAAATTIGNTGATVGIVGSTLSLTDTAISTGTYAINAFNSTISGTGITNVSILSGTYASTNTSTISIANGTGSISVIATYNMPAVLIGPSSVATAANNSAINGSSISIGHTSVTSNGTGSTASRGVIRIGTGTVTGTVGGADGGTVYIGGSGNLAGSAVVTSGTGTTVKILDGVINGGTSGSFNVLDGTLTTGVMGNVNVMTGVYTAGTKGTINLGGATCGTVNIIGLSGNVASSSCYVNSSSGAGNITSTITFLSGTSTGSIVSPVIYMASSGTGTVTGGEVRILSTNNAVSAGTTYINSSAAASNIGSTVLNLASTSTGSIVSPTVYLASSGTGTVTGGTVRILGTSAAITAGNVNILSSDSSTNNGSTINIGSAGTTVADTAITNVNIASGPGIIGSASFFPQTLIASSSGSNVVNGRTFINSYANTGTATISGGNVFLLSASFSPSATLSGGRVDILSTGGGAITGGSSYLSSTSGSGSLSNVTTFIASSNGDITNGTVRIYSAGTTVTSGNVYIASSVSGGNITSTGLWLGSTLGVGDILSTSTYLSSTNSGNVGSPVVLIASSNTGTVSGGTVRILSGNGTITGGTAYIGSSLGGANVSSSSCYFGSNVGVGSITGTTMYISSAFSGTIVSPTVLIASSSSGAITGGTVRIMSTTGASNIDGATVDILTTNSNVGATSATTLNLMTSRTSGIFPNAAMNIMCGLASNTNSGGTIKILRAGSVITGGSFSIFETGVINAGAPSFSVMTGAITGTGAPTIDLMSGAIGGGTPSITLMNGGISAGTSTFSLMNGTHSGGTNTFNIASGTIVTTANTTVNIMNGTNTSGSACAVNILSGTITNTLTSVNIANGTSSATTLNLHSGIVNSAVTAGNVNIKTAAYTGTGNSGDFNLFGTGSSTAATAFTLGAVNIMTGTYLHTGGNGNINIATGSFSTAKPNVNIGSLTSGDIILSASATNNITVSNLTPSLPGGIATKQYVDNIATGIKFRTACQNKTTTAEAASIITQTITGSGIGKTITNAGTLVALTVDGNSTVVGSRILVASDAVPSEHYGIYIVTTVGSASVAWVLTRATDFDSAGSAEVAIGAFTFMTVGSVHGNQGWVLADFGGTIDNAVTGLQTWSQFYGSPNSSASPTYASATMGNIRIGVTTSNTINTTSGALIITPTAGQTMTIGNNISAAITIGTASGGVNIGTGASSGTITIGSTTVANAVTLQSSSSAINLSPASGQLNLNATGTGAITIGGGSAGTTTINVASGNTILLGGAVVGSKTITMQTGSTGTFNINTLGVSGAINIGTFAGATGAITLGNTTGGGQIILRTAATDIVLAPGTSSNAVSVSTRKITNVVDPTAATDAATKGYVDAFLTGLKPQQSVRVKTTTADASTLLAQTLTGAGAGKTITEIANGALTIDGTAMVAGDRVLVYGTGANLNYGIYDVTNAGSAGTQYILTRSADFDETSEVLVGSYVFVTAGSTNINTAWCLQTFLGTVDTSTQLWTQIYTTPGTNPTFTTVTTTAGSIDGNIRIGVAAANTIDTLSTGLTIAPLSGTDLALTSAGIGNINLTSSGTGSININTSGANASSIGNGTGILTLNGGSIVVSAPINPAASSTTNINTTGTGTITNGTINMLSGNSTVSGGTVNIMSSSATGAVTGTMNILSNATTGNVAMTGIVNIGSTTTNITGVTTAQVNIMSNPGGSSSGGTCNILGSNTSTTITGGVINMLTSGSSTVGNATINLLSPTTGGINSGNIVNVLSTSGSITNSTVNVLSTTGIISNGTISLLSTTSGSITTGTINIASSSLSSVGSPIVNIACGASLISTATVNLLNSVVSGPSTATFNMFAQAINSGSAPNVNIMSGDVNTAVSTVNLLSGALLSNGTQAFNMMGGATSNGTRSFNLMYNGAMTSGSQTVNICTTTIGSSSTMPVINIATGAVSGTPNTGQINFATGTITRAAAGSTIAYPIKIGSTAISTTVAGAFVIGSTLDLLNTTTTANGGGATMGTINMLCGVVDTLTGGTTATGGTLNIMTGSTQTTVGATSNQGTVNLWTGAVIGSAVGSSLNIATGTYSTTGTKPTVNIGSTSIGAITIKTNPTQSASNGIFAPRLASIQSGTVLGINPLTGQIGPLNDGAMYNTSTLQGYINQLMPYTFTQNDYTQTNKKIDIISTNSKTNYISDYALHSSIKLNNNMIGNKNVTYHLDVMPAGGHNGAGMLFYGNGTNNLAFSTDGVNVLGIGAGPFSTNCTAAVWNGFRWCAGGAGTNVLAYSDTGRNFTGLGAVSAFGGDTSATCEQMILAAGAFNGTGNKCDRIIAVGGNNTFTSRAATAGGLRSITVTAGSTFVAGQVITVTGTGAGTYYVVSVSGNVLTINDGTFSAASTVTSNRSSIIYSYDGINYYGIPSTGALFTVCSAICFNGNVYLAGGTGGSPLMRSTDLYNWAAVSGAPFNTNCRAIAWSGTTFVAVGTGSTHSIAYSVDNGVTFVGLGLTVFATAGEGISWSGEYWLASGSGSNWLAWSKTGQSFTGLGTAIGATNLTLSAVGKVSWSGNRFYVGITATGAPFAYTIGSDPTNALYYYGAGSGIFTSRGYGMALSTAKPHKFTFPQDKIVFVGDSTSSPGISTSIDGGSTATSIATAGHTGLGYYTCYSPPLRRWVVFTNHSSIISISDDNGATWVYASNTIFVGSAYTMIWFNDKFIAFGPTSFLAYSYDAYTWFTANAPFTSFQTSQGLACSSNMVVAAGTGTSHTLAYSYDGINYVGLGKTIFTTSGCAVGYNGKIWAVLGTGTNNLATSLDGINFKGFVNATLPSIAPAYPPSFILTTPTGRFIAGQWQTSTTIWWSDDAHVWTAVTSAIPVGFNNSLELGGNWCGTRAIIGCGYNDSPSPNAVYTYDGTSYTTIDTKFAAGGTTGLTRCVNWNKSNTPALQILQPTIIGGTGVNTLGVSLDGVTVKGMGSSLFTTGCNGVCWNGVTYVMVGSGGNALVVGPDQNNLIGLGNSAFGGDGNTVANGVCWGGNKFVAVATLGTFASTFVLTAGTQTTLTIAASTIFASGQRIVVTGVNAGTYLIDFVTNTGSATIITISNPTSTSFTTGSTITDNRSTIIYSFDSINWIAVAGSQSIFSTAGYAVAYGGGTFAFGGAGASNTLASATNSDTLTVTGRGTTIFSIACKGIAYGFAGAAIGNRFLAVGSGASNGTAYSADAVSWLGGSTTVFGAGGSGNGVCYGVASAKQTYVATAGGAGSATITATNDVIVGSTLTAISGTGAGNTVYVTAVVSGVLTLNAGTFAAGTVFILESVTRFLVVGETSAPAGVVAWSHNGATFTTGTSPHTTRGNGCCYNSHRFNTFGEGGSTVAYSYDAYSFFNSPTGTSTFTTGRAGCGNPKIGAQIVPSRVPINYGDTVSLQQPEYYDGAMTGTMNVILQQF